MMQTASTSELPVRVLFVNHAGVTSGAEESLLALLEAFDGGRVRAELACPRGDLSRRAADLGFATHDLACFRPRWSAGPATLARQTSTVLRAALRLRALCWSRGYDIIHANSTAAELIVGAALVGSRVPHVWHVRDLAPLRGAGRGLAAGAHVVIAISHAVARHLATQGVRPEKCEVIYNGIAPDAWGRNADPEAARASLGFAPTDRIVTMAAQLVPWKRHEDFIRAVAGAGVRVPRLYGVIAGSDLFNEHAAYRRRLKAVAREVGVADRLGWVGRRKDMASLLAASDAVAVPSTAEPFGRVALEAMALGIPVIGTRAGGLPELIDDCETGLLVPPLDWRAMRDALLKVLRYPGFAAVLGRQGKAAVRARFDIKDVAARTERVYRRVLGGENRCE